MMSLDRASQLMIRLDDDFVGLLPLPLTLDTQTHSLRNFFNCSEEALSALNNYKGNKDVGIRPQELSKKNTYL